MKFSAEIQGYEARLRAQSRMTNPYAYSQRTTPRESSWERGWLKADYELKQAQCAEQCGYKK